MVIEQIEDQKDYYLGLSAEFEYYRLVTMNENADLILIEGYKFGSQPKIQLLRRGYHETPVGNLENTIAYVADFPYDPTPENLPVFDITEPMKLAEFLFRVIRNKQ